MLIGAMFSERLCLLRYSLRVFSLGDERRNVGRRALEAVGAFGKTELGPGSGRPARLHKGVYGFRELTSALDGGNAHLVFVRDTLGGVRSIILIPRFLIPVSTILTFLSVVLLP